MKKTYNKPEILFEDFSLSTSITAGCTYKNGLHVENACGYETGRGSNKRVVFVHPEHGCVYTEDDGFNGLCYHNPGEGFDTMFNS